MSTAFGWLVVVCVIQFTAIAVAVAWVNRKQRANSAVTRVQRWLILTPLALLLLIQWWLSFQR